MDEREILFKTSEVKEITERLKSHYYLDDFFIDPDKKFLGLLKKITDFFENDNLFLHIQQTEILYESYKQKYEDAAKLVLLNL